MSVPRCGMAAVLLTVGCGGGDSPTDLPPEGPDLIVSSPDAPGRVAHGRSFFMDVAVLNRGTPTAGRTQVLFLHSADRTITTADAVIVWIYQIYRSYSETGEYALVRDFLASADLATYVDGGLEPNTVYYYQVDRLQRCVLLRGLGRVGWPDRGRRSRGHSRGTHGSGRNGQHPVRYRPRPRALGRSSRRDVLQGVPRQRSRCRGLSPRGRVHRSLGHRHPRGAAVSRRTWEEWALTDSNRRPPACKAGALNQLS